MRQKIKKECTDIRTYNIICEPWSPSLSRYVSLLRVASSVRQSSICSSSVRIHKRVLVPFVVRVSDLRTYLCFHPIYCICRSCPAPSFGHSRSSEPGSHCSRLFSPLPTAVHALGFYREKDAALSSLVDSRGNVSLRVYGEKKTNNQNKYCLLYTSPSPRDLSTSRMPSSA